MRQKPDAFLDVLVISRRSGLQILNIGEIIKFLTPHAAEQIVHSFVASKLEGCKSLLFGISKSDILEIHNFVEHNYQN